MVVDSRSSLPNKLENGFNGIRYIPHPCVKTKKVADEAVRVARRIAEANGAAEQDGMDINEQALFRALHTCAYRAARRGRCKPIPRSERAAWFKRWKIIRDHIVHRNLGLVYSTMARFHTHNPDRDEMRSEALFAVVRAVEGFDPWRGFRFSTYACNAITRSLIQEARRTAKRRLRFVVGYEVWQEESERVDTWSEVYVDRLRRTLELNLGDLTDRESAVLARRFPSGGGEGLTLGAVGRTLGLSKERVRQIQNRALRKLREVLEADPSLQ